MAKGVTGFSGTYCGSSADSFSCPSQTTDGSVANVKPLPTADTMALIVQPNLPTPSLQMAYVPWRATVSAQTPPNQILQRRCVSMVLISLILQHPVSARPNAGPIHPIVTMGVIGVIYVERFSDLTRLAHHTRSAYLMKRPAAHQTKTIFDTERGASTRVFREISSLIIEVDTIWKSSQVVFAIRTRLFEWVIHREYAR